MCLVFPKLGAAYRAYTLLISFGRDISLIGGNDIHRIPVCVRFYIRSLRYVTDFCQAQLDLDQYARKHRLRQLEAGEDKHGGRKNA